MSTIIQIKRSANVGAPTTADLLIGELAYSYDKSNSGAGAKLYIEALDSGDSEVIHAIGGKYYTDAVDGATSNNTANKIVKRDASGNFAAGIVTANVYGNANTATRLATTRYINLSGDATGTAAFDGTANADITVTVSGITNVALGTNTTGDYVANLTPGTGINLSNLGGESANVTVALTNTGVVANTYGGGDKIPVITFDAQGRATYAANVSLTGVLTASSIAILTNKTFDVSNTSNNKFSIQGNDITSYAGSGSTVLLDNLPTINGINIGNGSQLTIDGGTGSYYWTGQSGVVQSGNFKAGIYSSTVDSPDSLFTFGASGANTMSVSVEGSLFVGTALPTNNGGLNTSYDGWLVVQSGGKFGGTINTLGALQFDDALTGKIIFADNTEQNTAFRPSVLTTANVAEVTNLYFTNTRAREAITSGNTILYNSSTGNITLSESGVTASTYGGATQIPAITVDRYGRVTAAANTSITVASEAFRTIAVSGQSDIVADSATDTLNIANTSGISLVTDAGTDTLTIGILNSGVSAATYGGTNRTLVSLAVDATGRITSAANISLGSIALGSETTGDYVSSLVAGTGIGLQNNSGEGATPTIVNTGVTSLTGTSNEVTVSAANGSITIGLPDDVIIGRDLSVTGNLYVTGNVVALPVENLVVNDSLIQLANNNISTDIIDIGFYGSYNGDGGEHEHAGLFRDASDSGRFKLFQGLQGQNNLTSTINVTGTGFSIATLVANLTGGTVSGLTANIAVGDGGTGRGTLTTNAVLFGQGTSAVGLATGSAYQVLQLNASGVPVFAGLDGGSY